MDFDESFANLGIFPKYQTAEAEAIASVLKQGYDDMIDALDLHGINPYLAGIIAALICQNVAFSDALSRLEIDHLQVTPDATGVEVEEDDDEPFED
jgi:hypothetical protein